MRLLRSDFSMLLCASQGIHRDAGVVVFYIVFWSSAS